MADNTPAPKVRMPKVLSGQYGEIEAADALAARGFEVVMYGGQFALSDGTADRHDLRFDVQVKATAKENASIRWNTDGEPARRYADAAEAAGRIAVFVFVHAIEVHEAYIQDGEIRFPRPKVKLYAATARKFADDVDAARDEYAREVYKVGARKGTPKSPDGCVHPAFADEYPTLDEFIAEMLEREGQ